MEWTGATSEDFNPLNAELNPICHLLALLGSATIVVISRLRVNAIKKFTCSLHMLRNMIYMILLHVCKNYLGGNFRLVLLPVLYV